MKIHNYFVRMEKECIPSYGDIRDGALVLYENGRLQPILGHLNFYTDHLNKWFDNDDSDITDFIVCWFKKY